MSARCSLVVNGKSVRVSTGDTQVDDAVSDGMMTQMQGVHGAAAFGQGGAPAGRRAEPRAQRAEPMRLKMPAANPLQAPGEPELAQESVKRSGTITEITRLCPGVVEAVVTLTNPLAYQPGHQVVLSLTGWHPVTLTPSLRVDGAAELNELVFHIGVEAGVVAGSFAGELELGKPVKVQGPVGRGQYRPGGGRMVLVADEAGFAGIWAIARAARYIEPAREQALVVGARDPLDLYMRPALDWLTATGVSRIITVADRNRQRPPDVRPGPLTAHIPMLRANDAVHVSGRAATVGAVEVLAASVGARCYTIPLDATI
ncbi:ferredoxin--NAD(+) reductase [Methylobacterium sp. C25]|uniref:ferredoxin--NAD(+) reductase n=1 Tax=Methylobacterium sp. C25 TaxID=2721622 RepID=UPI001F34CE78|nr:ferredoxin--NAD(+) reductase [Methylobacterium sp. C25]MCE4222346.1 ferredoxin--NAD(+) reductase [Methylobacterium sp. C25]